MVVLTQGGPDLVAGLPRGAEQQQVQGRQDRDRGEQRVAGGAVVEVHLDQRLGQVPHGVGAPAARRLTWRNTVQLPYRSSGLAWFECWYRTTNRQRVIQYLGKS